MATESTRDLAAQRTLVARLAEQTGSPPAPNLLETHISWVLLDGKCAYKIKKAVNLGFLDFSTLDARRHYCEQELRLNRRLAPALYLDVVAITGSVEHPVIGGSGPALDYAVKMREFPQDALLSHVLQRHELRPAHIDALAADIAAFHARVDVAPPHGPHGIPAEILEVTLDIFAKIEPWIEAAPERALLDKLRTWTRREHAARAPVFSNRLTEGFVRECHGDLHLGNIALVDGAVTVFDCIEFNDRFRWIDVASEIAFTVMDLDDRGSPGLAHRFLNAYLEITGDYAGLAVLRFYLVYRAMVRAMVACLRAGQMEPGAAKVEMRAEYHGYLDLADRYAHAPHPAIVVMHGLSGCGKTALSQALLERVGAVRVRTDVERKRIHGFGAHEATGSGVAGGIYGDEANAATYRRAAALVRGIAGAGYVAIVDAAFLKRWQRDLLRQTAADLGIAFVIVHLDAGVETLRSRIVQRTADGTDASEADLAVLERQVHTQEPLAPDEMSCTVACDAEMPLERALESAAWRDVLTRIGIDVNAIRGSAV